MGMPLRPGERTRLGRYELLGRLGEGGMGSVYLGREDGSGRRVAIKVIRAEYAHDAEFRARFRSEVSRAKQVPPFSTAEVLDADPDHDPPYLVVEFVDGPSLATVIKEQGPMSGSVLHGVAVGIATALTAIHGAGVIHRDLKPGNVLLAMGGVKVIDFGIARPFEATSNHTGTDQMVGTVAYMAPERFDPAHGRQVTSAADVFSWGAVVQFAATGRTPFAADSPAATAMRILTQPPDLSGLPESLRSIVERSLAKDPVERPTARDLLDMLLAGGAARGVAVPRPEPQATSPTPAPWQPVPRPDERSGEQPAAQPGQWPVAQPGQWATASAPDRLGERFPGQPGYQSLGRPADGPGQPPGKRRNVLRTVAVSAVALVVLACGGLLALHRLGQGTDDDAGSPATPSPAASAAHPKASPTDATASILRGNRRTLIHVAEIDRDLALDRHDYEVTASDGTGVRSQFVLVSVGVDYMIKSLRSEGHPQDTDTCLGVKVIPDKSASLVAADCNPGKATLFALAATGAKDDKGRPTYRLSNESYGFVQWSPSRKVIFVEELGDADPTASFSFVDRGAL